MNKVRTIIILLIMAALLTGCRPSHGLSSTPNTADITETRKLTASLMSLAEFNPDETTAFQKEHYIDVPLADDPMQYLQRYIDEFAVTSVSDIIDVSFRTATKVVPYPILGTNLEATDLIAYLFYIDEQPTGLGMLRVNQAESTVEYYDYTDGKGFPLVLEPHSIEACYSDLVDTLGRYPDFDIKALVYATHGYSTIYPIGHNKGESTVQFIYGGPKNFLCVEPFATIEEGREALHQYLEKRAQMWSAITVYPWTEDAFYSPGYLNVFQNTVNYKTLYPSMDFSYLDTYDTVAAIPLLDNNLQENVYVLHLLYYRNNLIGELVIKREKTADGFIYTPVWENVAKKDTSGEYIGIAQSQYEMLVSKAQASKTTWDDVGVVFNGQFVPVGYEQNKLTFYDATSDTMIAAEQQLKTEN